MSLRVHSAGLDADPGRVIAQLFLPGEESGAAHSRAAEIIERVLAIAPEDAEEMSAGLQRRFAERHPDVTALFLDNADIVSSRLVGPVELTEAQRIVLGASFTAEVAVEGAALCNPSAVEHPDQRGLEPGQLRLAVAVRCIGEGHRSSIGFVTAVVGPGRQWQFDQRELPLYRARIDEGEWQAAHFRAVSEHEGVVDEVSQRVIQSLPAVFTASDVDVAVAGLPGTLSRRATGQQHIDVLRELSRSAYRAQFAPESTLTQRVLLPVAADERQGVEDARFVRFTTLAGEVEYRATYTAYDGQRISPRLIVTDDLRDFRMHRLAGDAAHDKGMALFPRPVGGRYLALSRTSGENISLAESDDGVMWTHIADVHRPAAPWELVQTGNCGSPLETSRGWLVLTHGVGPMRSYSLGAILLDLDDPTIVLGRTTAPLLEPTDHRRDGYVPNVVYSCGAIIHDDVLWIPIGIGDRRIGVCSIEVEQLLAALIP